MTKEGYIALAIIVLAFLLAIFVISFLLYVRTPVPKGCQKSPSELCSSCKAKGCEFALYKEKETTAKEEKDESDID